MSIAATSLVAVNVSEPNAVSSSAAATRASMSSPVPPMPAKARAPIVPASDSERTTPLAASVLPIAIDPMLPAPVSVTVNL